MSYHVRQRYGGSDHVPGLDSLPALLAELGSDLDDDEHGSVGVVHESGWMIAAYLGGLVTWEP